MRPALARSAPGMLVAATLLGCRAERPPVVVGLAYASEVAELAQAAIDSASPPGGAHIIIDTEPVPSGLVGAVAVARRLTTMPGLVAVVGPPGSGDGLLTAPIFNDARIVQLLPTATAPEIRAVSSWSFMLAPDDTAEARFLAEFTERRFRPRAVTIFYVSDSYGIDISRAAQEALERAGVTVDRSPVASLQECRPERTGNPVAADVRAALKRLDPDVVILAARVPESVCVIDALGPARARRPIVAADGVPLSALLPLLADRPDTIFGIDFWVPPGRTAAGIAFTARFERRFQRQPSANDALIYDALVLAATAIRAAGPAPDRIRSYLTSLGRERPPFAGVSGDIVLPVAPDARLVAVTAASDGRIVPVAPNDR